VLDDGHITSADGRKISLKNTIIIMTTNVGARFISEKSTSLGFISEEKENPCEEYVKSELLKTFRPEFINRIDEIVVFNKLTRDNTEEICRNIVNELIGRTAETGYMLKVTDTAIKKLSDIGYSEKFGARNLYRTIIKYIENPVSEEILKGREDKTIIFDEKDIDT
jgi:ATP-dependent Clp protease ATP-binding subunit ClpC